MWNSIIFIIAIESIIGCIWAASYISTIPIESPINYLDAPKYCIRKLRVIYSISNFYIRFILSFISLLLLPAFLAYILAVSLYIIILAIT
jgi:hypothetical protein